MADTNVDRAKLAYETFRGGFNNVDSFNSKPCPLPPWDEAPIHVREVVFVAYLQGTLDGHEAEPQTVVPAQGSGVRDLLRCPLCARSPHRGPTKAKPDQLHGDRVQRYRIWCPLGCAQVDCVDEGAAIKRWNTRSPAPATTGPNVKLLVEALRDCECPRPANGDPSDTTVGQCFDLSHCGCQNGVALRSPAPATTGDEVLELRQRLAYATEEIAELRAKIHSNTAQGHGLGGER